MLYLVMLPIGEQIYLKRLQKGISQLELALKAGIPQPNLSNIEKGKRDITVLTLRKIAHALDAHPREFFDENGLDEHAGLDRNKIERLAKMTAGKTKPILPEEAELTALLQTVISKRGRKYARDLNKSWLELRKRFTSSEIAGIIERSDEFSRGKR